MPCHLQFQTAFQHKTETKRTAKKVYAIGEKKSPEKLEKNNTGEGRW